ncbi:unnamed protein product, partial [Choristocarpus tenellus]
IQSAEGNPLTFLVVLGAGHMVPLDVPEAALEMLGRFLNDQTFADASQGLKQLPVPASGDGPTQGGTAVLSTGKACEGDQFVEGVLSALEGVVVRMPVEVGTPMVGLNYVLVPFQASSKPPGLLSKLPGLMGGEVLSSEVVGNVGGGGWRQDGYEVVSSPGGLLGVGEESPVRVEGLTPGKAYTFSVSALWSWHGKDVAGEGGEALS